MDELGRQALPLIMDLLTQWLPPEAAVASVLADPGLSAFPEELNIVASAVSSRRADFLAGRVAAHRCLEQIGCSSQALLRDEYGGPVWPVGVTGSITHDAGVAMCIAMRSGAVRKLGIDLLDTRRRVDFRELAPIYLSKREMRQLDEFKEDDLQALFCMKESLVKIFSGDVKRFLDLREIEVIAGKDSFVGEMPEVNLIGKGYWKQLPPFVISVASLPNPDVRSIA